MRLSKSLRRGSYKTASSTEIHSKTFEYAVARRKMVEEQLRPRGIIDLRVLATLEKLPRHLFVDEALISQAYQDTPLHIGWGQTISQPYTVALLAQTLALNGNEKILEIGTGCGFQTAVLADLVQQVYSIERLSPLLLKARVHLKKIGIRNVVLKLGDGSRGWSEKAPFDAIVAAAVSPTVPQPLLDQLKDGGRLVMPVERKGKQHLIHVKKHGTQFHETVVEECRFVKMVGVHGFRDGSRR